MSIAKDVAEHAVEYGLAHEASYVETRVVDSVEDTYASYNGMILAAGLKHRRGIGLRVLAGGGMGFSSTTHLAREPVEEALATAITMAKVSRRADPITFSEEPVEVTTWETPVKRAFADVTQEEKMQFLTDLDKRLQAEPWAKHLKTRTSLMTLFADHKYLVTSEGAQVESRNSIIAYYSFNTAKGPLGSEQRMLGRAGTAGWEWLEEEQVVDTILADNEALVKAAQEAKPKRFDHPVDVIISPEVAGICAHENVGHPSEGDRILGREGAQAGESFYGDLLHEGEIGAVRLGSDAVTIVDDPTLPRSAGFYLYDDEGVKARPRYLVKDGLLNELLLNREFAARFDRHSNGAARAINFDREPITRMANTFFQAGDHSLEELVEDVSEGLYMKSFTEWNIDDRRFQSKYTGLEAYLIEDGQITDTMVRRPVLELTTLSLLGAVDAVGKNFDATYAHCGKSDPMQGVPVWTAGVDVRLRDIRLGGQ